METQTQTQTQTHQKTTIKFPPPNDKDKVIQLNSSFLFHNGGCEDECLVDNIEMIAIQSVSYTSLKDLIPSSTSPGSLMMSPSAQHNSSWYEYEIPIKNPLVKHAALAYLQPMSTPPEVGGSKGLLWKLRDRCRGEPCGCVGWVSEVVMRAVRGLFFWTVIRVEVDDEDDGEEEEEKVDRGYCWDSTWRGGV